MRGRLLFVVGTGVGYVLGTRAGRERYEAMKAQADALWHDPRVQDKVAEAGAVVKERAPEVPAKLAGAAGAVKDKVHLPGGGAPGGGAPADAPVITGEDVVAGTGLADDYTPEVPDRQTP